jgi:MoaA/NifB/PqqE/SkfB family radical SAM enzyme/mannose-6-phosphate isomerase-like protein (cupin superfamily)
MIAARKKALDPRFVRLETSTVCQLKCPSCPTTTGATGQKLGVGSLKFEDFKKFIRRNPQISHVELSNWGEVFLNRELVKILAYAYRRNVYLYVANGANLNHLREDVPEALVKYKLRRITCSIDGASQETYARYRVQGDFNRVVENIKAINRWKTKYRSPYPELKWQFVAFGHNEHEIARAREMAGALGMSFFLKLSWGDLYDLPDFSPVRNKELVGKETGLGVSSRKEYLAKYGRDYVEHTCCWDLWNSPQINYDGRMLGCPINYWGDYGNVFDEGLDACLNGEKMEYARDMLMGKREPKEGIPCTSCKVYDRIKKDQTWVTEKDVEKAYRPGRRYILFENKIFGEKGAARLVALIKRLKESWPQIRDSVGRERSDIHLAAGASILPNQTYPVSLPLPLEDEEKRWNQHFLFRGPTKHIRDFSCHVSVLISGCSPHPPHAHKEEEILIMLSGEADLLLPRNPGVGGNGRMPLKPGELVYYPPGYPHSLRTTSEAPANYLMLRWDTSSLMTNSLGLGFGKYNIYEALAGAESGEEFSTRTLFEGPSGYLSRLQCHASLLSPGAGYARHADVYDVVIVVLEGEVETLGKSLRPHGVVFHPAGQLHGMANPGKVPAKYVVFEFQK